MREMNTEHQDVGYALVSLTLKMVFSQPEGLIAGAIHQLSNGLGFLEYGRYMFIGEPALVDRGDHRGLHPLDQHVLRIVNQIS